MLQHPPRQSAAASPARPPLGEPPAGGAPLGAPEHQGRPAGFPPHLRDRLREALGGTRPGIASPAPAPAPDGQELQHLLPGFWQDTRAGRVFVIERRFELDHRHGRLALGRALGGTPAMWARIGREPALAQIDPRRAAFLDIETTGLSGGAGTVAFLVGIGHFLDGHFRLRQYFLEQLGQERALLRALADYLDGFEAVVTFNGKSFDLPLLQTRLILCGLSHSFTTLPHLDLLHPARRLYRDRLESCRLNAIERELLGLMRVDDTPGSEAPALYFRYLRNRRVRALLPLFEHNALDVLSLVTLTVHLSRVFNGDARLTGADRLALGRDAELQGRVDEAIGHFEMALLAQLRPVDQDECERRLAGLYKRQGRWDDATALWAAMAGRPGGRSLHPLLELAKYHEHVSRDFTAARLIVERALLLLERHHARLGYTPLGADRADLQRRLTRLAEREARARMPRPARRAPAGSRTADDA